jgi:asparagine N-glycosylation enzyme membrane subunit Stt3
MKIFRFIIIHLLMLFAAAMADIMLFGFMAFTVTCFAVAGVFSAVFCYAPWSEKETSDKNEMAALYRLMLVLSLCSLLFSGSSVKWQRIQPARKIICWYRITHCDFPLEKQIHNKNKKPIRSIIHI